MPGPRSLEQPLNGKQLIGIQSDLRGDKFYEDGPWQ